MLCLKRRRLWSVDTNGGASNNIKGRRSKSVSDNNDSSYNSRSIMAPPVSDSDAVDSMTGSVDLRVQLPNGKSTTATVARATPMMDVLVQVASAQRLSPGAHILAALSVETKKPVLFKPSTPIGTLDEVSLRLVPKNRDQNASSTSISTSVRQNGNAPIPSFRLQVRLPRHQLAVIRVTPDTTVKEVLTRVCGIRGWDENKYEIRRHDRRLDLNEILGQVQEVSLLLKGSPTSTSVSAADVINVRATAPPSSAGESSASSSDGGTTNYRGVSPSRSDGARSVSPAKQPTRQPLAPPRPPVRRQKRPAPLPPPTSSSTKPVAPKPPSSPKTSKPAPSPPNSILSGSTSTNQIRPTHSRHSSDSSGYHEASLLSESPVSRGPSPPDTLLRDIAKSPSPPSSSPNSTIVSSAASSVLPRLRKARAPAPPPRTTSVQSSMSVVSVNSNSSQSADESRSVPSTPQEEIEVPSIVDASVPQIETVPKQTIERASIVEEVDHKPPDHETQERTAEFSDEEEHHDVDLAMNEFDEELRQLDEEEITIVREPTPEPTPEPSEEYTIDSSLEIEDTTIIENVPAKIPPEVEQNQKEAELAVQQRLETAFEELQQEQEVTEVIHAPPQPFRDDNQINNIVENNVTISDIKTEETDPDEEDVDLPNIEAQLWSDLPERREITQKLLLAQLASAIADRRKEDYSDDSDLEVNNDINTVIIKKETLVQPSLVLASQELDIHEAKQSIITSDEFNSSEVTFTNFGNDNHQLVTVVKKDQPEYDVFINRAASAPLEQNNEVKREHIDVEDKLDVNEDDVRCSSAMELNQDDDESNMDPDAMHEELQKLQEELAHWQQQIKKNDNIIQAVSRRAPAVQMSLSSWNDRPTRAVSVKEDEDYVMGPTPSVRSSTSIKTKPRPMSLILTSSTQFSKHEPIIEVPIKSYKPIPKVVKKPEPMTTTITITSDETKITSTGSKENIVSISPIFRTIKENEVPIKPKVSDVIRTKKPNVPPKRTQSMLEDLHKYNSQKSATLHTTTQPRVVGFRAAPSVRVAWTLPPNSSLNTNTTVINTVSTTENKRQAIPNPPPLLPPVQPLVGNPYKATYNKKERPKSMSAIANEKLLDPREELMLAIRGQGAQRLRKTGSSLLNFK